MKMTGEFRFKLSIQQTAKMPSLFSLLRVGINVTMFGFFRSMTYSCGGKSEFIQIAKLPDTFLSSRGSTCI